MPTKGNVIRATDLTPAGIGAVPATDVVTSATASKILKLDSNAKLPASITGNADGNAATATKLQTARTFAATGDATASAVSFDGTGNVSLTMTLPTVNSNVGTFSKVTVNAKGQVTAASNLTSTDVTSTLGYTPVNKAGDTMTGLLTLSADPTTALQPATKQLVDRRIAVINENSLKAATPIDNYPASAVSVFKVNGSNDWVQTTGVIVTFLTRDTFDDNKTGAVYPGSVHQYFYAQSGNNIWHRVAKAALAYTNISRWTASTAVAVGAYMMPSSTDGNGYYYRCTTAGTTGTTEPTWATDNSSITDGTAVWTMNSTFWGSWDKVLTNGTIVAADIPNLDWTKITTGKPTTLAGYGITDNILPIFYVTTSSSSATWVKIAEMNNVATTGVNASGLTMYLNATGDYGSNQQGLDILQASTRGSIAVKPYRLIRAGNDHLTYGYVDNATTGKVEIWLKESTYTNEIPIMVSQTKGGVTYGSMLTQMTEPAGIVYVTKQDYALLTDNVASATKLQTARTLSLTGDATGSMSFDGTSDVSTALTLANSGATAGTYKSVTVDAKGRVTAGTNPTTLTGYGITDAMLRYVAPVQGVTWSRILQMAPTGGLLGHSFLMNISGTRSSVVYSASFIINTSTNQNCSIIQLGNTIYSNFSIRGVVDINGDGYIEFYDTANGATTATVQNLNISITKLQDTPLTAITVFTDGTTVPGTHAVKSQITTVSGNKLIADLVGNADTATKLATARTISLTGDVIGSVSFDGTGNATISTTLTGGISATGNIQISKATPRLILNDNTGVAGNNPAIVFSSNNAQNVQLRFDEYDGEILDGNGGYSLIVEKASGNNGTAGASLQVEGNLYSNGYKVTNWNDVSSSATANKIAQYNSSGKLPASITGDAATVNSTSVNDASSGSTSYLWTSNRVNTELQKIVKTTSATLPATAGWYRIAQSVVDQQRNSARFEIDWILSGYHGQVTLNAGITFASGVELNQSQFTTFGTSVTKARIVYHTSWSGNYAYLEIYNSSAVAITVNVQMMSPLGWSLVTPSTTGSIPAGYTSKEITFNQGFSTINQFKSTVPTGTAPLAVDSTTVVTNLNADMVDGYHLTPISATPGTSVLSTIPVIKSDSVMEIGKYLDFHDTMAGTQTDYDVRLGATGTGGSGSGTLAITGNVTTTGSVTVTGGIIGSLSGNASTATKLATARTISFTGDLSGSSSFDGSADVSISVTDLHKSLTALTDTLITSPANGHILQHNGTNWINNANPLIAGAIQGPNVNAISATAGWFKLGTIALPQLGHTATIRLFGGSNYNASDYQISVLDIVIRTSNNSITTGGGTAVGAIAYRRGGNTASNAFTQVKLVQNAAGTAATSYDVYINTGAYIGNASYEVIGNTNTTWTHVGTSATDPGAASSTVYVVPMYFKVVDPMYTANNTLDDGNGNIVIAGSGTFSGTITAPTFSGALSGNASTATKLQTARTLSWSGDATGSFTFDGSNNASTALTLANSGVTSGTYTQVTVNSKGLVTSGANPTTLSGYGITDAQTITGGNGYYTTNTSSTYGGQWTKVLSVTLSAQYGHMNTSLIFVGGPDGNITYRKALVDIRVKQQATFGNNPLVQLNVVEVNGVAVTDFAALIVQNTPTTIVDIYMRIAAGYEGFRFSGMQMQSNSATTSYLANQPFVASIPAGTQIAATDLTKVLNSDIVTTATASKILRLDSNGKLPANITGDANSVNGYSLDQDIRTTASPTFAGITVSGNLINFPNATISNVTAANNSFTGSVINDTVIRNESNTDILLGFKGTSGIESPALKLSYNGAGNSATVSTQKATLDDGSGAATFKSVTATNGSLTVLNPNNASANANLSWLNDTARIRIGGSGTGVANGFQIQGVGDSVKFSVNDSGDATVTRNLTVNGTLNMNNSSINNVSVINGYYGMIAKSTDEWLRFNDDNSHALGTYFGTGIARTDGTLQVGNGGSALNVTTTAFQYKTATNATNVFNVLRSDSTKMLTVDTLNSRVGVNIASGNSPLYTFDVGGNIHSNGYMRTDGNNHGYLTYQNSPAITESNYNFYANSDLNYKNSIAFHLNLATTTIDKAWTYNGTTYTDRTTNCKSWYNSTFTVLTATTDYFYIADGAKFGQLYVDVTTFGAGLTLVAEYWNGIAWTALTITTDGTANLTRDGWITWTAPADWATTYINESASTLRYWIRFSTTTAPTTNPVVAIFDISAYSGNFIDNRSGGQQLLFNDRYGNLWAYGNITANSTLVAGNGTLQVNKSGNYSTISFPAQTNDPGYIKHYENNNNSTMFFSVSDDVVATDYFAFGSSPNGVFTEGARIGSDGSASFNSTVTAPTFSGNASTASKLAIARTISLSTDATGSVSFDGSADITIAMTLANSGVTAGTYTKVTVDAKGRVTSGTAMSSSDITTALAYTPVNKAGDSMSSDLTFSNQNNGISVNVVSNASTPTIKTTGNWITGGADYAGSSKLNSVAVQTWYGFSVSPTISGQPVTQGTPAFYVNARTGDAWLYAGITAATGTFSGNVTATTFTGALTGNASTATKLATARSITISGDTTASATNFDGSANITLTTTLANSGVTAGTYRSVTVDAKGRVTAGTNPTTASGYGLTDVKTIDGRGYYSTAGTGVSYAGQWTKVASINITAQYGFGNTTLLFTAGTDSGATYKKAVVDFRLKQQNVMASAPIYELTLAEGRGMAASDFIAVITTNTVAATTADLYVRVGNTNEQYFFTPHIQTASGTWTFFSTQSFVATLPAGTQITCTDKSVNTHFTTIANNTTLGHIKTGDGLQTDGTGVASVVTGTGITLSGTSPNKQVSLDTTYTDGRYVQTAGGTMSSDLTFSNQTNGIGITVVDNASSPTVKTTGSWITGGSDYAGSSKLNSVAVQTSYGFSVSPTISGQTVAQGTPAFYVDARSGNAWVYSNLSAASLSGKVILPTSHYASTDPGMNVNNSDIIGANNIAWSSTATSDSKALQFPKSTWDGVTYTDWSQFDSIRALDGTFYFNSKEIPYIVDKGTSVNGSYVKYSDGTMICRQYIYTNALNLTWNSATVDTTTATHYYSSNTWTYPASFYNDSNYVNVEISAYLPAATGAVQTQTAYHNSYSDAAWTVGNIGTSLSGTQTPVNISLTAIGRWKA